MWALDSSVGYTSAQSQVQWTLSLDKEREGMDTPSAPHQSTQEAPPLCASTFSDSEPNFFALFHTLELL